MTEQDREQVETRQGPEDPARPAPDGPDTQPPPRSPMRTDDPEGSMAPIPGAQDPGPQVQRVTRDDGPDDVPPVSGVDDEQGGAGRDLQAENAATSADQPSG